MKSDRQISIVVVTCNRKHLLSQCLERVLSKASNTTKQIIIWDNASTDGTTEVLGELKDSRIQVVRNESNIGTNAYARAFRLASGTHFIELDDDVIDAPENWDRELLDAFLRVPQLGFLAAGVVNDGKSVASHIFYERDLHLYVPYEENGVKLLRGPVGGWCTMTSRKVYEEVGGFQERPEFTFWHEDGAYVGSIAKRGYTAAILPAVLVFHASGPAYSNDKAVAEEKARYHIIKDRHQRAKERLKWLLELVPPIRWLNARFRWYTYLPERLRHRSVEERPEYWRGEDIP